MLTSRGATTEVQNLLDFLNRSEIAIFTNPVIDRRGFVTWRSPDLSVPFLFTHGHPSVLDYRHWLSGGHYSAVLFDGALLQINYRFSERRLVSHRLCFVPCPYMYGSDELLYSDIDELLELYEECRPEDLVLASAIRFDFDADAAAIDHPASHLTVNAASCRVPCNAPMRLGHFVEFVFKHFYPEHWASQTYLRNLSKEAWMAPTTSEEERRSLHLAWSA